MIVKNEEKNIIPLLDSLRGFVDCYAIVDTGSDDNTISLIKEYTKDWLPGKVISEEWIDFPTNRNQALDLARASGAKWAFVIDADDELAGNKNMPLEDGITYCITRKFGQMQWEVPNLLWLENDWKWLYKIHEAVVSSKYQKKTAENIWINCNARQGCRTNTAALGSDIDTLKALVEQDPKDSRSWFYLASSYATKGDIENAVAAYKKRAELGGWEEEVCISNFMVARFGNITNMSADEILDYLIKAHDASPMRAEPLYDISFIYRTRFNNAQVAYPFAKMANNRKINVEFLFASTNIYSYGALHELALCCHYTGRRKECHQTCKKLRDRLPLIQEPDRSQIEKDLRDMTEPVEQICQMSA